MAHQNRKHSKARRSSPAKEADPAARGLHKDWRVWLAVGLMLAAMLTYVLTLDDSVVPYFMRQ